MPQPSALAKQCVEKIIRDLSDRRGLRQEWEQMDKSIQREIHKEWAQIIDETYSAEGTS